MRDLFDRFSWSLLSLSSGKSWGRGGGGGGKSSENRHLVCECAAAKACVANVVEGGQWRLVGSRRVIVVGVGVGVGVGIGID